MTNNDPKLACPSCAYELTDLPLSNGKTTCPECGMVVIPVPLDTFYSYRFMHTELAVRVLLPTTVPLLLIVGSLYFHESMTIAGGLMIIGFPFVAIFCFVYQYLTSLEHNNRSPRKISKLMLVFWLFVYSIPGFLSYYLLYQTMIEAIFNGL